MTIDLTNAVVYDIETFPNVFTLSAEMLNSPVKSIWEISEYRDDRRELFQWFDYLKANQIPMIGFFSLEFDYPVIHYLMKRPNASVAEVYAFAMEVISDQNYDRFKHTIWPRERFAPQIDLFKVMHFDNKAKRTSLKALEINMRSDLVMDMPVKLGTRLTRDEVETKVKPYNGHDTGQTKKFAQYVMSALQFRIGLMEQINGDVMNFSDVKIGVKLLEQRIGEDICYERKFIETDFQGGGYTKKSPRQTYRSIIKLDEIIFNYVQFQNPEFKRVLEWLKAQTLTPEALIDSESIEGQTTQIVQTKGVFKNVTADVGDVTFYFGTGGIHASVKPQRIIANDEWLIQDVDVKGFYPAAAIVNRLAPAHLGEAYVREYTKLPIERDDWQKKKGKKCVEANSLKLSSNGVYGQSNNPFSVFYDPQYTMTVTINCQLLLCMLAEWLLTVPTIKIIQANTDGITYLIHRDYVEHAKRIWKSWEEYTLLTLEDTQYKRMFIRDVNNYIAEDMKGNLKQKGAYWHPDPFNYAQSISECQPPAWHKDLSNVVSIQAAVAAMVHGVPPEIYIPLHTNKFDFMLRAKIDGKSKLMLGDRQMQKTTRYYVANNGEQLRKISPPSEGNEIGQFKKKNGITDHEYRKILALIGPGVWDERIHTKNKSTYEDRITMFEAGWKIAECNNANDFNFHNVCHRYYIDEAHKLII